MSVVVDRFEVVPEPQPAEQPAAPAGHQAAKSGPQLTRQIEATLHTLQARNSRLRAN